MDYINTLISPVTVVSLLRKFDRPHRFIIVDQYGKTIWSYYYGQGVEIPSTVTVTQMIYGGDIPQEILGRYVRNIRRIDSWNRPVDYIITLD